MSTPSRKLDHIRICVEKEVESEWRPFGDLMLVHRALPEIDASKIDTRCKFLGRDLSFPMMICAMTGGHPDVKKINVNLALAAQEVGVALGVGSQRAALENPELIDTFSAVRDVAPDVPLVGNIGSVQLQRGGPKMLENIAEMIDADAIAIHLNALQECIQPEGEAEGNGALEAIKTASAGKIPLIVKETGAGISWEDASALVEAGVKMIDVGGLGGTSWAGVEVYRAEENGDMESAQMGRLFWDWGVPTPVSIVESVSAGATVISSGGIRSGLDVAKSLALGATVAGCALPLLAPAIKGPDEVAKVLCRYAKELRTAMFLTGSANLAEMSGAPMIVRGNVQEILEQRGFDTRTFATRKMEAGR